MPLADKSAVILLKRDIDTFRKIWPNTGIFNLMPSHLYLPDLVLIARILVAMRGDQYRETLGLRRKGDRAADLRAGALRGLNDLPSRLVDQSMVEGLETNPNDLLVHNFFLLRAAPRANSSTFFTILFKPCGASS